MTRPVIGVTTSRRGGWRSFLMHRLALYRAGAHAVRLVPGDPIPDKLDGLVIGGGDDIGAEIYGSEVLPDIRIDPERDKLELKLLDSALPGGWPILGICRGSQMINVALVARCTRHPRGLHRGATHAHRPAKKNGAHRFATRRRPTKHRLQPLQG